MDTRYNPRDFEDRIYRMWEENELFKADADSQKEAFSIVLPPPNITGQLHMGHALDQATPDVLIRYKRMKGFEALWLPGTDHASIATEVKVWDAMREEGIDVDKVTREEFLQRAWAWKEKYENRIISQMKKLGDSCDWSRLRFTMDKKLNDAVNKVFVELYNKGLIYKGYRMVNWCCECGTSISDIEVEHIEKSSNFYHVNYKVDGSDEYLEIATTRPETIFGDTAIAVNPNDERYRDLIGKYAIVPVVNRRIPIIGDEYVDIELGTGALKVTPCHDPNDFEIGQRHNLESINVLNPDGTLNENVPENYRGMSREQGRKAILEEIKASGQLVKVVPLVHNVGTCYRCHTDIEPSLSNQWFVKMEDLAKPALEALNKDLFFLPERFGKIYTNWLEDIKDWCISRQLWWGHRIPAYYCDSCGHIEVSTHMPQCCSKCGHTSFTQDEDVLDTWFSSALWPFSTMGWPEETKDFKKFYPTSLLVTGHDIIFFWVIRMVFSAIEQTGSVPFRDVIIHGLVRDEQGRKMSKSLGNGIDPLEEIENYGADALRFMLLTGTSAGNDMRYLKEKIEYARNFANKLWNASRFVLTGVENTSGDLSKVKHFELVDKWILTRLTQVKKAYFEQMDKYEVAFVGDMVLSFIWDEYCDWYIEIAKLRQYGEDKAAKSDVEIILVYVLRQILMMMHPFMPFITEEIWSNFNETFLIREQFDDYKEEFNYEADMQNMAIIMSAIKSIRNARAEMNIPNSKKARLFVKSDLDPAIFFDNENYFIQLANVSELEVLEDKSLLPEDVIVCVSDKCEMFMPSDDLIDYAKELERLTKELKKAKSEVERVVGKLNNEKFMAKAPAHLVEEEREKQVKYEAAVNQLQSQIGNISKKIH